MILCYRRDTFSCHTRAEAFTLAEISRIESEVLYACAPKSMLAYVRVKVFRTIVCEGQTLVITFQ